MYICISFYNSKTSQPKKVKPQLTHFSQALVLQHLDSVVDGRHRRRDLAGPEVRRRVPWRGRGGRAWCGGCGGSGAKGREERIDLPRDTENRNLRRNLGEFRRNQDESRL